MSMTRDREDGAQVVDEQAWTSEVDEPSSPATAAGRGARQPIRGPRGDRDCRDAPGRHRGGAVHRDVEPGTVDEAMLALAHRVVELAASKKASDIVLLDVRGQTAMTDYFVICSGASDRQLGAIADGIVEGLRRRHPAPSAERATPDLTGCCSTSVASSCTS